VDIALSVLAALALVPIAVVAVETAAALLPGRRGARADREAPRQRCAVLVPAHNEEEGIGPTLKGLLPQLQPGDRLLVVADNCDLQDRTAVVARELGATVVERHDPERRGKGFALDFGVRELSKDPPAVVLIIDADCAVGEGAVDVLVRTAAASGRPAQGEYVMDLPPGAGVRAQVSAFAFRFKNIVRPRGLDRLGLPCQLLGTGMAFPWPVLRDAPLATGHITEDINLGADLALAGHPARFCAAARVRGVLPSSERAAASQRTRWEHGHLQTLLTQVPRLLAVGLLRPRILGLALDLAVPPLSLLVLLWGTLLAPTLAWWAVGGWGLPAALLAGGGAVLLISILTAWFLCGRGVLPFGSLLAAPFYALAKVPIYVNFIIRRQLAWVRTPRDTTRAGGEAKGEVSRISEPEAYERSEIINKDEPPGLSRRG
jgi:cellulose synthase/poly-beta-1,6-N-acetylglucosamine synthase-like glycosyltransferase